MDEQKRKAIIDLIETVNDLSLTSILLIGNGANMLRAKEKMDLKDLIPKVSDDSDPDLKAG